MSPIYVPQFSPIGESVHVLWLILQSVRNEERNQAIKMKF